MRNRAWRRKADWHHALRRRRMNPEWYTVLHRYSKGKIHCSCPLCACKTRRRHHRDSWSLMDMRRRESMDEAMREIGSERE